ncbi:kinase-like protein, partial [Stereum hirsutum FP-91666 SS1]|uniref:kinase-like protein n=1 Tax=Stereum hirsutum (strain FP-91666) TaxID=721885 RepID=UPI000440B99E
PFMVSEYCKYGNVCEYLRGPFPEADRLSLLSGIVSGMIYLHGNSIVHGDLKGVNVLVDDNHQAILADFGISRLLDDTLTIRSHASLTGSLNGTFRWMAPECLSGTRAKKSSDVYSFAITAWEIFSGEVPFFGIYEPLLAKAVVDNGERPKRPGRLDKEENDSLWKLMESCWDGDPSARPSFVSIQDTMKYDLPRPKGKNTFRNLRRGHSS